MWKDNLRAGIMLCFLMTDKAKPDIQLYANYFRFLYQLICSLPFHTNIRINQFIFKDTKKITKKCF